MSSELLFASFRPETLDPSCSFGIKFQHVLKELDLPGTVRDRKVAIKMHLGGGSGFSTIHPFFVRKLVQAVRDAGAKSVFVTDMFGNAEHAIDRGYTEEVIGCPIVPVCNRDETDFRSFPVEPPFKKMNAIELGVPILESDVLIDFSHVKGHGVCGYGGASKNLSMGAVTTHQRRMLHSLEGGLTWDEKACIHCGKCIENCPRNTMRWDENGKLEVIYHNCKFCQHCALICPKKAIQMEKGGYLDFQRGMAMTSAKLLEHFMPGRCIFLNMIMDVTIFCDCWGMTTPRLIPDIGMLAGRDIVAIETATLDLVNKAQLIPGSLPDQWPLDPDESKHLFQRIHGKDPYAVVRYLEELGCGTSGYTLRTIR